MQIAITGANGFVGSHLIENLKETNNLIFPIYRYLNEKDLMVNDLSNKKNWNEELKNIDVLIHCAGLAHISSKNNQKKIREVNVEGLRNILKSAIEEKVKRIIYISSIKVLGEHSCPGEMLSNKSIVNPKDPYGISKKDAEDLIRKMTKNKEIDYVIIRPSLIYGARLKANFLQLIKLLSFPLPIPLPFLGTKNRRSFLYIKNLTDFIKHCCYSKKVSNKALVISDKESISTKNLIKLISKLLKRRHLLFYLPTRIINLIGLVTNKKDLVDRLVLSLEVNSNETFEETGFNPRYTIKQGLKETIEWFISK